MCDEKLDELLAVLRVEVRAAPVSTVCGGSRGNTFEQYLQARMMARLKGAKPLWLPLGLLISLRVVLLGGTLSIFMLTWR